jgi:hypothetical protein
MDQNRTDRPDPGLREILGAWALVLVVISLGLALSWRHAPGDSDRAVLLRWYDPPIASAEAEDHDEAAAVRRVGRTASRTRNDDISLRSLCERVAGGAPPPPQPPIPCNIIAGRTPDMQLPVFGAAADRSETPC